ncbi:hypothetical protein [Rahnella woolbedingensis]|uniref:Uncharacterized protein n=1 Tax=Rahnella woolbedingensis TaxID=1510574 RepID=A0A419N761_9GAMM|nr:hypothetical protein [Rahnella woolbedingensis]RJT43196.1 hypothetical protein D6C13_14395 [Rahnella woolbedingensis]
MAIKGLSDGVAFYSGGINKILNVPITPALSEVLWWPKSEWFVVNYSDGGLVGAWNSYLYFVKNNKVKNRIDISHFLSERYINLKANCDEVEELNYGVVSWTNGGGAIIISAEVPPHSSCKNMGETIFISLNINSMKLKEEIKKSQLTKAQKNT